MYTAYIKTEYKDMPFIGENEQYHYIYKIVNLYNGMEYTGLHSTDTLNDGYCGSGVYITNAIEKNGIDHFKKVIVKFFKTRQELSDAEQQIVTEEYVNSDATYNLKGGGLDHGIYISEETAKKISLATTGLKRSDETKEKIRQLKLGRVQSEETKKKRSETLKEGYASGRLTPTGLGRKMPEHQRQAIIAANSKPKSAETRAKMSYAQSHRSAEYQEKINRGKWKKVRCVETGEIFDSAKEASIKMCEKFEMKVNEKAVSFAIRNKVCFPRKKYHWEFVTP